MRNGKTLIAAATALLAACAAGPDFEAPASPVEQGDSFVTRADSFDPAAPVPDDWWRLYRDPALDALVARALSANTDLRVAAANLARARALLSEARAGRLPSTNARGGGAYGDAVPGSGGSSSFGDAELSANAGIDVAWEVDLFGRVGRAIEAARADTESVAAARDAVRVAVAAETTRSYLDACTWSYALDVARKSHETSIESLNLLEARQEAGSAGRLEVERAAGAAARARAEIPRIEALRQVSLFELAALLGTTPDDIPLAALECTAPPALDQALPVGDGAALLRRRPDIRQAERELAAGTARIGVAKADLYPSITLGGSLDYFRSDALEEGDAVSFSLGPLISWSFPNRTVAQARVRQAEADRDAALARFDGQVLTALKEVEQALTNVAREGERLAALDEARDHSQTAHRMADLRYRAGSASYLDVLQAQQDLLDARAAHATSLQRLSSARVDLFRALGGGWRQEGETSPGSAPADQPTP